jgi:hypothetical protein
MGWVHQRIARYTVIGETAAGCCLASEMGRPQESSALRLDILYYGQSAMGQSAMSRQLCGLNVVLFCAELNWSALPELNWKIGMPGRLSAGDRSRYR